jgi:transcriptional regulator with XRE-family HTH domain
MAVATKKKTTRNPSRRVKKKAPRKARNLTIQQMADGIGVGTTTIEKYVKRGCPRTSIDDVIRWRKENIKAVAESADKSEVMLERQRAELAKTLEQAREKQIANDIREGLLLSRSDVEREWSLLLGRLRNKMQGFGLQCANVVPAELKAPVKALIDEQARICLKELAEGKS